MIFCDKILNFVIANDRIRSLRRKSSPLATESDKKWVLWIKMSPGPRFMRYDHFLTGLFWVCTWLKSSKKSIDISKSLGIHSNSPKLARNTRKSSKQSKNNQKSSNQSTSQNHSAFTQTHPNSLGTLGNHRNNQKIIKNRRNPTKKWSLRPQP